MVDGGDKVVQKVIPGTRHLSLMTMQHIFQELVAGEPPRDFEQRIRLPHCHNIWVKPLELSQKSTRRILILILE
jgi:hypothetical protein